MSNGYTNNSSIVSGLTDNKPRNLLDMGNAHFTQKMQPAKGSSRNNVCCERSCATNEDGSFRLPFYQVGPPAAVPMCPNACVNINNENRVSRAWIQPASNQMPRQFSADWASRGIWRMNIRPEDM